jgi:tetratricopeptide (TPR) repeat protein/hypothetical membrane protein
MRRSNETTMIWAVVTVVTAAGLYAGHLGGPFIFDDSASIVRNQRIEQLWPPVWLQQEESSPLASRPLAALSMAISFALHGRNPAAYRATNLAIHLLNALLLMLVLRRLLARWPDLGLNEPLKAAAAGSVSLLWSVHPLQSEAVSYISQRTELIVGFCYLATLYSAMRAMDANSRRETRAWSGLALFACVVGAFTKEVIATVPVAVLLYDRAFVSGGLASALRRNGRLHAMLACTWLIVGAILVTSSRAGSVGVGHGVSSLDYLRTQAGLIAHYLQLCFLPDELRLSYPLWTAKTWAEVEPEGAVTVILAAATLWACWRHPRLGFAGAWFFLILGPSSSLVPIVTEIGAERRMYLPLAAVIGVVVVALAAGAEAWEGRLAGAHPARSRWLAVGGLALTAAVALALGSRTLERLGDYRSRVAIWSVDARIDPDNPAASFNLALALVDEERYAQALTHLDRGGRALDRLDMATQVAVLRVTALEVLPSVYQMMGRPDLGLSFFRRLGAAHPDLARVQLSYGSLCLAAGVAEEAVEPLQRAATLGPESLQAWQLLTDAYARTGRGEQALVALGRAIELAKGAERERLTARRARLEARASKH